MAQDLPLKSRMAAGPSEIHGSTLMVYRGDRAIHSKRTGELHAPMVDSIKQFKTGSVHEVLQSKRQARQDKSTNTVDLIICIGRPFTSAVVSNSCTS